MILTCPECKTKYKLATSRLGAVGRRVRCTGCYHVWFATSKPTGQEGKAATSKVDEIVHDSSIPLDVVERPLLDAAEEHAPTFDMVLRKTAKEGIPQGVKPLPFSSVPSAPVYKPMGMSAPHFGGAVFLCLVFISLILVFSLKGIVVRHFPAMTYLYEGLGVELRAPGEGLRLSALHAEHLIDHEKKTLSVTAKLANMTSEERTYPSLQVTARSPGGQVLHVWDVPVPPNTKSLDAGEERPIELEFGTVPEDTAFVDMDVVAQ